ncbi:MAG: hypothetical protein V4557_07695 [Bacteroidota bacterium]
MRKLIITCLVVVCTTFWGHTQDCKVLINALSLKYEGECKGNKADGKGKAVGQDSYEGQFKAGYPDGEGIYTWKEGDFYDGSWKKGLREGQGSMHFKKDGKDSVVAGFWKKDIYQGRFEKPYKVLGQSSKVSTVRVTKNIGSKNYEINMVVSNTSGNTTKTDISASAASGVAKMKLTDIDIQKGNFTNKLDLDNAERSTKTIIRGVEFPFKATFRIEGEMVQIEFLEEGNYTVEVNILQ